MSKLPRYINSPSWRRAGNEVINWLAGAAYIATFFLALFFLGLALTGGAR